MNKSTRYAFKLFYIGDRYLGFQKQKNGMTVQGRIFKALKKVKIFENIEDLNFGYSSRTDKYVHSVGQVIAFNTSKKIILPEINDNLPNDIKFYGYTETSSDFKARYLAKYRHYKYVSFRENLDIDLMNKGAKKFTGVHDFRILSKSPHPIKTSREIYDIKIQKINDNIISIDVFGRSFMREMVRRIASVLLDLGERKLHINDIEKYFYPENKNKIKVRAAPIKDGGELILYNCEYGLKFKFIEYSMYKIKKFLWKRIRDRYASLYANKSLFNYFNQIE
ncbi:MAG: tRNA pseudouridine(38-40) synthase TruA [Candidatus Lokiarchaeota archaeon]|nr:tRNA pseudouridine(38-40) synthase TruA [Candidatus Lokiarchaeota archaeon]